MVKVHERAFGDPNANIYGYNPNFGAGVFFSVMFGLFTLVQFVQMIHTRDWAFGCIFTVGAIGELIGWIGRTLSHDNVSDETPFLMQIICLVISPCFFSAAMYYVQGQFARSIDIRLSLIRPKFYLIIFSLADLVSLILQGAGGGMSASAEATEGGYIDLGGIAFQLFATAIFVVLEIIFLARAKKENLLLVPGVPLKSTLVVYFLSWFSFWIIVRCIYRVVELGMGWTGYVQQHEWFVIVFDTIPMFLLSLCACVLHPGYLVTGRSGPNRDYDELQGGEGPLSDKGSEENVTPRRG